MPTKKELITEIGKKYIKKDLLKKVKPYLEVTKSITKKDILKKLDSLKKDELEEILNGKKVKAKTEEKVLEISLKPNKWTLSAIVLGVIITTLVLINNNGGSTVNDTLTITYLVDGDCTQCYDVTINEQIITNSFDLELEAETIDVSSIRGQELINKYGIEKIPTYILTGKNINSQTDLITAWVSVGTVETDGSLVFRAPQAISNDYQVLENGEFVMYVPPETTIGNFMVMEDEVCTENGKPIVYMFGSTSCPHCLWEQPIMANVTSEFGSDIVYKENMGTSDYIDVLLNYSTINPQGAVPFIVIGCKYVRLGSGEAMVLYEDTLIELNKTYPSIVNDSLSLLEQANTVYLENNTNLANELFDEANVQIETLVLKTLICNLTSSSVC